MTGDELVWRARAYARIQAQRAVARLRPPRWNRRRLGRILAPDVADAAMRRAMGASDWQTVHQALVSRLQRRPSRFVLDPASADTLATLVRARWPDAAAAAAGRADRILAGRYDVLGYHDLRFTSDGRDLDWHLDPVHQRRAPAVFWADVPYLDSRCGDHKVIWELNRHQHWLQLVRAFWLTGDVRYRDGIVERLEGWLVANPPLVGINWASMLEIGFRAMSWTWALHGSLATFGCRPPCTSSAATTDAEHLPWLVDMLVALDRQLTHVEQNLSYYFSPNTHLTGEALALYVVGLALPELAASERWAERGRDILCREIDRQIHPDGGHVEGSTHYHRYTLDIYLCALLTARRTQDTAAIPRFTDAVTRLAEFTRTVADDRGLLPLIGDDDGGMLWPIAERACRDVRDSLALAAVALGRADLAPWGVPEEVWWVGGREAIDRTASIEAEGQLTAGLPSRTFRDCGYVVARDAAGGHAVFDVGRHGYLNGGHAHADALAITLDVGDRPLLVDPGTATYSDRTRRDQMRGSAAHNTVTIDGRAQSIPGGPFQWRTRSDARLQAWRHNPAFDWAEASHDGYAPLQHRRTLLRTCSGWFVVDEILGSGPHTTQTWWHFDPDWAVTVDAPGRIRAADGRGRVAWLVHDAGSATLHRGDDQLGLGWYAPVYGVRVPAWAVDVRSERLAPFDAMTWVGDGTDGVLPSLARLLPRLDSGHRAIAACVSAGDRTSVLLVRPGEPAVRETRQADLPDYQSNARVLHYASRAGTFVALDIIDGSHALSHRDGWLGVAADGPIAELHVGLEEATIDLWAFNPPSRLRLEGQTTRDLQTVRLNGCEWPMSRFGRPDESLVVDAAQWATDPRGLARPSSPRPAFVAGAPLAPLSNRR